MMQTRLDDKEYDRIRADVGKVSSITPEAREAATTQRAQEHRKREAEITAVADELVRRERAKKKYKCPEPLKF